MIMSHLHHTLKKYGNFPPLQSTFMYFKQYRVTMSTVFSGTTVVFSYFLGTTAGITTGGWKVVLEK